MAAKKEARYPSSVPINDKKRQEIKEIMNYFADNTYNNTCNDEIVMRAARKCQDLWEQDYKIHVFNNNFCTHYPAKIFIPLDVKNKPLGTPIDVTKLHGLVKKSHVARCRRRFPVPVILFNGNYVCRSSTTSSNIEALGRLTKDLLMGAPFAVEDVENGNHCTDSLLFQILNTWRQTDEHEFARVDEVRKADADLLDYFKIKSIVDLMVEYQKIKYLLPVSSSEKDLIRSGPSHHKHFDIFSTPYPGCEFFTALRPNHYQLRDELFYQWGNTENDAQLNLPRKFHDTDFLGIKWPEYRDWSLVKLTQNYIKLILSLLEKGMHGILVHCISGWDRTPLFIAIIRLSLWADGLIHTSLDSHDMVYLTVVYDWLLFGHHWTDRQAKGEDIFFFCYAILTYLRTEDFSIQHMQKKREEKKMADTEAANRSQHMFTPDSFGSVDNANGNGMSHQSSVPLVSISEEHGSPDDDDEFMDAQNFSLPEVKTSPRKGASQPKSAPTPRTRCLSGDSDSTLSSFAMVNDAGSIHDSINEPEMSTLGDTSVQEPSLRSQRLYEVRSIFSAIWFGAMGQDGKLVDYGPQAGQQGYIRSMADVASRFGRAMSNATSAVTNYSKGSKQ